MRSLVRYRVEHSKIKFISTRGHVISFMYLPSEDFVLLTIQVMLECAGMSQPIFVVTGSCQGIEISLDSDSVPFGAVVLGSRSTRKLIMHNTGDIGAAFNWSIDKFQPDFSISPVKGYISPGMEVSFEILFHPTVVNHDMRYEVSTLSASENSDYFLELGSGKIRGFINLFSRKATVFYRRAKFN